MPLLWGLKTVPASSHQFSSRSRQILGGPPMQAICCRLFQSASSSSASIFCTYSMADNSPASSLTMPCHERKQNLQHAVTSPTEPQVSHSQARKKSLRALLAALLLVLAMQNYQTLTLKKGDLHPGESGGPVVPHLPCASGPALSAFAPAAASSAGSLTGCSRSGPACLCRG